MSVTSGIVGNLIQIQTHTVLSWICGIKGAQLKEKDYSLVFQIPKCASYLTAKVKRNYMYIIATRHQNCTF